MSIRFLISNSGQLAQTRVTQVENKLLLSKTGGERSVGVSKDTRIELTTELA